MKYTHPNIEGWMSDAELLWLNQQAQKYSSIVEIGSFKGRSTHALLSSEARVVAIDNWQLHWDKNNPHHGETVFKEFKDNLKGFKNLEVIRLDQNQAVQNFEDSSFDMVFMDFTTDYSTYKQALQRWTPKAIKLICGDEYNYETVKKAVDETFGKPDGTIGKIWWKLIN